MEFLSPISLHPLSLLQTSKTINLELVGTFPFYTNPHLPADRKRLSVASISRIGITSKVFVSTPHLLQIRRVVVGVGCNQSIGRMLPRHKYQP